MSQETEYHKYILNLTIHKIPNSLASIASCIISLLVEEKEHNRPVALPSSNGKSKHICVIGYSAIMN